MHKKLRKTIKKKSVSTNNYQYSRKKMKTAGPHYSKEEDPDPADEPSVDLITAEVIPNDLFHLNPQHNYEVNLISTKLRVLFSILDRGKILEIERLAQRPVEKIVLLEPSSVTADFYNPDINRPSSP
jgi:hypothetical protein